MEVWILHYTLTGIQLLSISFQVAVLFGSWRISKHGQTPGTVMMMVAMFIMLLRRLTAFTLFDHPENLSWVRWLDKAIFPCIVSAMFAYGLILHDHYLTKKKKLILNVLTEVTKSLATVATEETCLEESDLPIYPEAP